MWLYPEVMPARRRRRLRLWMVAVLATVAASVPIVLAMPRAEAHRSLAAEVRTQTTRLRLEARIATLDRWLAPGYDDTAQCDLHCSGAYDRLVHERAMLQAQLRRVRARISLAPDPRTGVPVPPACVADPNAAGCS